MKQLVVSVNKTCFFISGQILLNCHLLSVLFPCAQLHAVCLLSFFFFFLSL